MYSLTNDTAIKCLMTAGLIEEADGIHEHKASIVRYTKVAANTLVASGIKYCCLRMSKYSLVRLYKTRHESASALRISALYTLGIGVPVDVTCARFWYSQVHKTCACEIVREYAVKLLKHLKSSVTESYYVYTDEVERQQNFLKSCEVDGTQCAVVYKDSSKGFQIHNLISCGKSLIHNVSIKRLCIERTVQRKCNNVKYLVRLGTLEKSGKYAFHDENLHNIVQLLCRDHRDGTDQIVQQFSKWVYFDYAYTIAVDYNWNVSKLKKKL
jgi:hypothetical protein